jgi:cytochrome c553
MTAMTTRWGLRGALAMGALAVAATAAAQPLGEIGQIKAVTCTACHGQAGNSKSTAMPILAGMNPEYFKKQIEAYAAGKRPSPEMEPYAKQVRDLGVDDLAAYFASQKKQPSGVRVPAAAVDRGRAASAQCVSCHGPEGKGDPAKLVPDISGQAPGFLRQQMELFKQDRRNPGDQTLAVMKALMKTLPDSMIDDLAAYYSSIK